MHLLGMGSEQNPAALVLIKSVSHRSVTRVPGKVLCRLPTIVFLHIYRLLQQAMFTSLMVCFDEKMLLNTHISELDTQLYQSIPKWSLTYIHAANLPGYYETRTNTTIHITNSHNFSNVLSTMRVFLVYLV